MPQKVAVLYEVFCSWGNYKDFLIDSLAFNNDELRGTVVKALYNEDINENLCFEDCVKFTRRGGIWIVSK